MKSTTGYLTTDINAAIINNFYMTNPPVPDLSSVDSPPRRSISYTDLQPVEDPIGSGGNAVVYEVTLSDSTPPDCIALKEPPTNLATLNRDTVKQFLEEAETWKTLDRYERKKPRWASSEHIVGIIDTGGELPWIAMEYMDGGSLRDRLDNVPKGLPLEEALWIGECICRGIELAHNYGIAHLDLKPANVLFRETQDSTWDVPKLADWGLARRLAKETGTLDGLSVEYAAPEQFDPDEFGDPDMLTDIYQVGAIVYTLLTGEPPYTGSQTSIMYDTVCGSKLTPPSNVREECPAELDQSIETALARSKTDRYRSISDFEEALNAIRTSNQPQSTITQGDNHAAKTVAETTKESQQQSFGWSTFQGNPARTGYTPSNNLPTTSATARWTFETHNTVYSSPAVADGTVYVGSTDNYLYAVDANDGTIQWRFKTNNKVASSPAVTSGTIYFGSNDGRLYAVDADDGTKQWQFEAEFMVFSSPVVVNGTVYVGSNDGRLYAVNADDGTKQWQFDAGGFGVRSSPAVVDGTVYVGSDACRVYAVDAGDGSQQWQFKTADVVGSSPAVADGTVYVGSRDGNLYAVDATEGTQLWQFKAADAVRSSPAVSDGVVYVGGSDGNLYAVDATEGTHQWQFESGNQIESSPTVASDTVYIGSQDSCLYAVDSMDGTLLFQFETGGQVNSSPAVANGTIYVGSRDGSLYALK